MNIYAGDQPGLPFSPPVYFSMGLINISKYEKGHAPSEKELADRLRGAFGSSWARECEKTDPHNFRAGNFLQNEKGCVWIDYGQNDNGEPFINFLRRNQQKLSVAFLQKNIISEA